MPLPVVAIRLVIAAGLALTLAACGGRPPSEDAPEVTRTVAGYEDLQDGEYHLPAVDPVYLAGVNRRTVVDYYGPEEPGTIVVDPFAKFLFHVGYDGTAVRYPIAVGREGKGFKGSATVQRVADWPGWTPTANMLRTEPEVYGAFRGGIPGGLRSPLGARALYLYRGGADTLYRIHGTNDLESIGNAGSAGCIRLFNQDIIDLANRVEPGARVVVRTYEQSLSAEGEILANRGVELPPRIVPPEVIFAEIPGEPTL